MIDEKEIYTYIFYIITETYGFGISRNEFYKDHFKYLTALKDMDPWVF